MARKSRKTTSAVIEAPVQESNSKETVCLSGLSCISNRTVL